ncbi:MAG: cobyric acid synthase CobQ, partial [Pseudomonadota bacterium]
TGFDLKWLKSQGWEAAIQKHLRYGGKLIGICGGLQMLGTSIYDPHGIEGGEAYHQGLGLLALETVLHPSKQLINRQGVLAFDPRITVQGYEIHCGMSIGKALDQPATYLDNEPEGALSADGQIFASYLHGLFDHPAALTALLTWAGLAVEQTVDINAIREQQLERLADTLEANLQIEQILALVR